MENAGLLDPFDGPGDFIQAFPQLLQGTDMTTTINIGAALM